MDRTAGGRVGGGRSSWLLGVSLVVCTVVFALLAVFAQEPAFRLLGHHAVMQAASTDSEASVQAVQPRDAGVLQMAKDKEEEPEPEDPENPWVKEDAEGDACPRTGIYNRIPLAKIRRHELKPYILGEERRPTKECRTCNFKQPFLQACRFAVTSDFICPKEDILFLLDYLLERADGGAPGYAKMLTMTPCDLFSTMRGRTLWLIGDSSNMAFIAAMSCFFREFVASGVLHDAESVRAHPSAWAKMGNYTYCVALDHDTRFCNVIITSGMQFVEMVLPHLPQMGALPSDVMVVNFGSHHSAVGDYKYCLYLFSQHFQKHRAELPYLIWRETSPEHFQTYTGDKTCPDCEPLNTTSVCQAVAGVKLNMRNELEVSDPKKAIVARGNWRNEAASETMQQLGVPVMRTWNHSLPLWQFHQNFTRSKGPNCSHSCRPSIYEMWLYLLYEVMVQQQNKFPPRPAPVPAEAPATAKAPA